jgi:hypothetical protein
MNTEVQATFKRFGPIALLLAIAAGVATLIGLFSSDHAVKEMAFQSYLYGYVFWAGLSLGCFGFTLFHHSIRGAWGLAILRLLEAGGGPLMLAIFGVLSIPLLITVMDPGGLYHHWTGTEAAADVVLQRKAWYLNQSFFVARTIAYFVIWTAIAYYLRKSSLREDQTLDKREAAARTNFASPMLIFFVISITLAATDWTMSLNPHWFSTIYGIIYMVGGALSAISLINILVTWNAHKDPYRDYVTPGLTKDLGNLMFVFTLLWAYTSLAQFLIIYMGNLKEFNVFYTIRGTGIWNGISLFLIFGQFIFPFVVLLAPRTKRFPNVLLRVSLFIFIVRFIEQYWNVMPFMRQEFNFVWTDVAAVVFFGAVWFSVFSRQVQVGALIPTHDPRLKEAYEHAS